MKDEGRNLPQEDDLLASRCKEGDVDAFEALVRKYQKKMLNATYRMLGDYEEACEVVQDAFVSAYRNIKGFKGKSSFSTWLFAIAMNHARTRARKLGSRSRVEGTSTVGPVRSSDEPATIEAASGQPGADEMMEKKHMEQDVQECIKRLDADYRAVLVLRDIQGFSYGEIGAMIGIPVGTVKSRLFRARDAVKECLKKVWEKFR